MKEVLMLLLMFWNVENFFDPFDDLGVNDNAFTPHGEKFWTWKKFVKKRDDIAKVIILIRENYGVYPSIIGLCEIENRFVLNKLITDTPLARLGYKIIHRDSPDSRGIDVAMLYNPSVFKVLKTDFLPLRYNNDSIIASRLILYVKGVVKELDTLHCFVNHWPSKLGGEKASLPRRMLASKTVQTKTDSIFSKNSRANVILMGDLNDTPFSRPVRSLKEFVNMSDKLSGGGSTNFLGTHKYKEKWELIDQFLVSANMAPNDSSTIGSRWMYCNEKSMQIFTHPFLLQRDELYLGDKLRKTLLGPKYLGGVSDHLPVILKVYGIDF